ncbi:LysR family transcriptional regulator [Massilia sp. CF038]|uniref:LysR family transcriptional regulator n=1 Tax=Massilia sp. CF038 TaxID=1881045 RepID=UPI00092470D1|nr:LysR family transcriptional regulator [Massilia sp. CF038]SHH28948.1 DNA-binding transcriptional regulator, LysR family [Massilia sp. CF038]
MNLSDLRVFATAARQPSLAAAALELHLTPSAVSKALRRLEDSLDTVLFDRTAKQLVLNEAGRRLLESARALLALADQARADLMGQRSAFDCRLGGPALLLWRHGRAAGDALRAWPDASLRLQAMFEDDALAALARGDINAALVTSAAIEGRAQLWSAEWEATSLGELSLQLVAGLSHPLLTGRRTKNGAVRANSATVLTHDFACPPRSLFCGVQRGTRSDGWRDDQLPRRIRYWTDDLQLLLGFVKRGEALAYLPDFALDDPDLVRIQVDDCAFRCTEQVWLVWNKVHAAEWQRALARNLTTLSQHRSAAA